MTTVLEHTFTPRGAAIELMNNRSGEVLLAGPAGTGKSRACLEKLHLMALLNPGMKGLIVRKTAVSLSSTALDTWEKFVVREAMMDGSVWFFGGSARKPPAYVYANGSSVSIGGMDKPIKIMSSEYDVVYVQEATELVVDDVEAITTRLRNGVISFQQLMMDCNPEHPTHSLKQRCDSGKTVMLHSKHEDNPRYFDDDGNLTPEGKAYMAKLDALTGVRKLRLRHGLWAAAEGVIYEEFNPAKHIVDRFEVPKEWTRWWSVDFGHTNPFVWQDWAQDPDGQLILVREIYMTGRLVEDHARKILDTVAPGGVWNCARPRAIVCDHDAEDRATLERHLGMATRPAKKNVSEGIDLFHSRLRPRGDGRPGLVLMRDAVVEKDKTLEDARKPVCTADEIPGYIWNPQKDAPIKENDHGCDAGRYVVEEVDNRQVARMRGWSS